MEVCFQPRGMIFAQGSISGERIKAQRGLEAACPDCQGEMVAKCGDINIHHWAHKVTDPNCDSKPETEWHRWWKSQYPDDCVEAKLCEGKRRGDVWLENINTVIEFQASSITHEEIRARQRDYYGKQVIWVVKADDFFPDNFTRTKTEEVNGESIHTCKWGHSRKSWLAADRLFFSRSNFGREELVTEVVWMNSFMNGSYVKIKDSIGVEGFIEKFPPRAQRGMF
jgi:competence CoiA-like predicted nuclease